MRKMHGGCWLALIVVVAAAWIERPAVAGGPLIDLRATRSDRAIAMDWSSAAEAADSLFGGYRVWRSTSPDPDDFILLRHFERRYPISWTFTPGPRRAFRDPDSIVQYRKVQVLNDSVTVRDYVGKAPFNGFPYYYAVTWVAECLACRPDSAGTDCEALIDTVVVDQPQPTIFQRPGRDSFYFLADGDTLDVARLPCFRINRQTNQPDTSRIHYVYRGTVESEEPLRHHAIEATRLQEAISPASAAASNLGNVAVVPNPYISNAPWEAPGERKIQFINLTEHAMVRIYTVGADLVRELPHPAPGSLAGHGSVDWDLRNGEGRLVESGIYIYQVETPGAVSDIQGRLVIVR